MQRTLESGAFSESNWVRDHASVNVTASRTTLVAWKELRRGLPCPKERKERGRSDSMSNCFWTLKCQGFAGCTCRFKCRVLAGLQGSRTVPCSDSFAWPHHPEEEKILRACAFILVLSSEKCYYMRAVKTRCGRQTLAINGSFPVPCRTSASTLHKVFPVPR